MARYIDVDKVINGELIPLAKRLDNCHPKQKKGVIMAMNIIETAPTADVQKVRHGEWIAKEEFGNPFYAYECSICSAFAPVRPTDFCPHCGAKMDGKDNLKLMEGDRDESE